MHWAHLQDLFRINQNVFLGGSLVLIVSVNSDEPCHLHSMHASSYGSNTPSSIGYLRMRVKSMTLHICDELSRDMHFQQCGILTSVDSDETVQPLCKLRNSKLCSVILYSSD